MYNSMKKLIIFALLFCSLISSCEKTNVDPRCFQLTFSDALPVQLWLNECQTYNEFEAEGVHHVCFCHPWNCSDPIKIQAFESFDFTNAALPGLPTYVNHFGFSPQWGGSPSRSVSCGSFQTSDLLKGTLTNWPILVYPGTVSFNYNVDISTSPGFQLTIILTNSSFDFDHPIAQSDPLTLTGPGTLSGTITLNVSAAYGDAQPYFIGVVVNNLGSGTRTFTLNSLILNTITPDPNAARDLNLSVLDSEGTELAFIPFTATALSNKYMYQVSFTPSSEDICDEIISFEIVDLDSGTPESVIRKSDCLSIKSAHKETILITYSNNRDFAGLLYPDVTPPVEFNIRIPAVFFEQRFPQESEFEDISNSRSIQLFSQEKLQRLLSTGQMPFYMHKKLILILQHQFVTINDIEYVKRESYELQENNKRWPLKRALCWLDQKDYIVRNIL